MRNKVADIKNVGANNYSLVFLQVYYLGGLQRLRCRHAEPYQPPFAEVAADL